MRNRWIARKLLTRKIFPDLPLEDKKAGIISVLTSDINVNFNCIERRSNIQNTMDGPIANAVLAAGTVLDSVSSVTRSFDLIARRIMQVLIHWNHAGEEEFYLKFAITIGLAVSAVLENIAYDSSDSVSDQFTVKYAHILTKAIIGLLLSYLVQNLLLQTYGKFFYSVRSKKYFLVSLKSSLQVTKK